MPSIGGLQNHIKLIANFAIQLGHEVIIVTTTPNKSMVIDTERPLIQNGNATIYQLQPWKWIHDSPLINPTTLYQLLKKINPDIIHVVKPFPVSLDVGVIYALRSKKRVVCTVINEVILGEGTFMTGVLQRLFQVYRMVSWTIWGRLIKKFSFSSLQYFRSFMSIGKYVNELIIIPPFFLPNNSHPLSKKEKNRKKEELGYSPEVFLAAFIGGLRKRLSYKRLDIVLGAWRKFYRRHPKAHLVVVGEGPMRTFYEDLSELMGIGSSVQFLGYLPRIKYQDVLKAVDCLILPSENNNEGFGIVIAEAMQMGALPIISNLPGPRGVVNMGGRETAPGVRFCQPRDIKTLEQNIWEIYTLKNRDVLAIQNFEYLRERFSRSEVFSSVKRLYAE